MPNISKKNISYSQRHDLKQSIPNLHVYSEELDAVKNKPIKIGVGAVGGPVVDDLGFCQA